MRTETARAIEREIEAAVEARIAQLVIEEAVEARIAQLVAEGKLVVVNDVDEATKALDARFDVVPTAAGRRAK